MEPLTELAESWLTDAEVLERYGDERGAELNRLHARELREALRSHERETLTLAEAAEESGYSKRHLRALISDGTIPNAGEKGRPQIRRGDLPMKPGSSSAGPIGFDADSEADAILESVAGR